jgi:hypothetical protein
MSCYMGTHMHTGTDARASCSPLARFRGWELQASRERPEVTESSDNHPIPHWNHPNSDGARRGPRGERRDRHGSLREPQTLPSPLATHAVQKIYRRAIDRWPESIDPGLERQAAGEDEVPLGTKAPYATLEVRREGTARGEEDGENAERTRCSPDAMST